MKHSTLTSLAFIVVSVTLFLRPVHDPDLWWHLGVGKFIWETKSLPYTDIFSFTAPDYPYIYHSWLSALILYLIHKFTGLWGISLFYAFLAALSLYFMDKTIRLLTTRYSLLTTYYLLLTIPFIIYLTNLRVQLISFLFLTILSYLTISQFLRSSVPRFFSSSALQLLLIPLLFLLWANFHGGFILGLMLLATLSISHAFTVPHTPKFPIIYYLLLISSLLAPLINPYTFHIYQQVFIMGTNSFSFHYNPDWLPLIETGNLSSTVYGSLLLIFVFTILLTKNTLPLFLKLSLIFFTILSFTYSRRFAMPLIILLMPATAMLIPILIEKIKTPLQKFPLIHKLILTILILTIFTRPLIWIADTIQAYQSPSNYAKFVNQNTSKIQIPFYAVKYLKENSLPAPIFNDFNWGGYLTWHLPGTKIFIDGRMDNFFINGQSFARQYAQIVNLEPEWQTLLDQYQIQTIFISTKHPLVQALKLSSQWQLQYQDRIAVIYIKQALN